MLLYSKWFSSPLALSANVIPRRPNTRTSIMSPFPPLSPPISQYPSHGQRLLTLVRALERQSEAEQKERQRLAKEKEDLASRIKNESERLDAEHKKRVKRKCEEITRLKEEHERSLEKSNSRYDREKLNIQANLEEARKLQKQKDAVVVVVVCHSSS